jgi:hypothetical protein
VPDNSVSKTPTRKLGAFRQFLAGGKLATSLLEKLRRKGIAEINGHKLSLEYVATTLD